MFSTNACVILAVGFISFVSGLVLKRESANEAALKCMGPQWRSDVSLEQSKEAPKTEDEVIEVACKSLREFAQCITNTNPGEYTSHTDMVHFSIAYVWQHMVMVEKAGLCKDMQTDKLKKITMESGIMEKENLPNVEEDTYETCVGKAMRKCIIRGESLNKLGISQNLLSSIIDYISCNEGESYSCHAPMMGHFVAILKEYKNHLEKNQGKFGKMAENITK